MSVEPYSLDANVLFYAIDQDAGAKHKLAIQLFMGMRNGPSMLAVQTLSETYWSVFRKRSASAAHAKKLMETLTEHVSVVSVQTADLLETMQAHSVRPVAFWDILLASTLRRNGCRVLLTEDMQDRPVSGGLRHVNPFTASAAELAAFLP